MDMYNLVEEKLIIYDYVSNLLKDPNNGQMWLVNETKTSIQMEFNVSETSLAI